MNIRLSIDEIVLEGFDLPPGGRAVLEQALSAELTQLFLSNSDGERFTAGFAVPEATAAATPRIWSAQPSILGRQLAGVVHGSLTTNQSSPLNPQRSTLNA
jgi:hypothetical protein